MKANQILEGTKGDVRTNSLPMHFPCRVNLRCSDYPQAEGWDHFIFPDQKNKNKGIEGGVVIRRRQAREKGGASLSKSNEGGVVVVEQGRREEKGGASLSKSSEGGVAVVEQGRREEKGGAAIVKQERRREVLPSSSKRGEGRCVAAAIQGGRCCYRRAKENGGASSRNQVGEVLPSSSKGEGRCVVVEIQRGRCCRCRAREKGGALLSKSTEGGAAVIEQGSKGE
ncbi:hypothetical protein Pint_11389 [Pistacia integerrima]|uniref:Uncharacterized protein n=1 Tax=Pistacia integerrima TaxID=434235 RepID=A0ACC0XP46_9ROSI|nr:hypothetical protein Pint_11389 [Pistacia integerrima]